MSSYSGEGLYNDKELLLELLEEQHTFANKFTELFIHLDRKDKFEVMGSLLNSDLSVDVLDVITDFIESVYNDLKSITNVKIELNESTNKRNSKKYLYDIKLGMFGSINTDFIKISIGRGLNLELSDSYFLTNYIKFLNKLKILTDKMNATRNLINDSQNSLFGNVKKHIDNYKKLFKKFIDVEFEFKLFLVETSKVVQTVNEYFGSDLDANLSITGVIKLNNEGLYSTSLPDTLKDREMEYNSSAIEKLKALNYEVHIDDNSYEYFIKDEEYGYNIKQFNLSSNYISVMKAEIDVLTELILPRREFTDFDLELEQMREYRFNNKNQANIKII